MADTIKSVDVPAVHGMVALNPDGTAIGTPVGGATATNQTDGSQKTQIVDGSGNVIGSTSNALDVNIASGSSAGTEYTEDDAAVANPAGSALMLVREDARAGSLTTTDGDNVAARGNNKGELYTKATDSDALLTTIDADTGNIATATSAIQSAVEGTLSVDLGANNDVTLATLPDTSGGDLAAINTAVSGTLTVNEPNLISTNNSTTTPLAGDATYTGTGDDVGAYSTVSVQIDASHDSATDGMTFQFSTDNTNWDDVYTFTYTAADGARRFQFPVTARYFRIVYTNGSTLQTHFRVQTIIHANSTLTSIHRLVDNVKQDRSAELVKSALIAQVNGSGDFVPIQSTASGILKIGGSVDVDDISAGTQTNDVKVTLDGEAVTVDLGANNDVTVTGTVDLGAVDNAVLDQIELNTDPLLVVGGGTEATAQRVTIANDSTGVVSVDDNGGALTVDQSTHDNLNANANVQQGNTDVGSGNPLQVTLANTGANATPVVVDLGSNNDVTTELTTDDLDTGAGTDTRAVVGLVGSASGGGELLPGSATDGLLVNLGANNDVTVSGVSTAANQSTIIGHVDGIETLLGTIDADTGNLPTIETNTDFGTVTGGGTETGALRVTLANNSTGVVSVDDNGGALTVDGTVTANAGTGNFNVNLQDGAGTDITSTGGAIDVNIASGSSSGTEYTEGDIDASLTGTVAMAEGPSDTATPLQVDASKHLQVDIAADSVGIGGGTQYTEDAAAAANPVGTAPILVRADSPAGVTTTDGDNVAQRGTDYGAAYVQLVTSSGSFIDSVGGGTEATDDTTTHSTGSTLGKTIMAAATPTDGSVDANDIGALAMSTDRRLHTDSNIQQGNSDVGSGNPLEVSLANTGANGTPIVVDLGANNDVTVTGSLTSAGNVTNAGTFAVQISDTSFAVADGNALGEGVLIQGDDGTDRKNINVDATTGDVQVDVTNTVTVDATSSGDVPITLAGEAVVLGAGSASVGTLGANSGVDIGDVTINNSTGASAVNIQDGGNSITVDNGGTFAVQSTLQTGSNTIGKLGANSGVDIGDVDVTSISAGTNAIGNVGLIGRTTGGMSIFRSLDLDETEEDVKTSAGQVFSISAFNHTAAPIYLKFYNATAANVTVGSTTPVLTFTVPGNADSDGAGFIWNNDIGFAFGTAICVAATTGIADADTGAPAANACSVNIGYV